MEPYDFLTPYLSYILGYLGLHSVEVIRAGDFFSLRTGRITRAEHLGRYEPAVLAAASAH